MYLKKLMLTVLAAFACLTFFSNEAFACACCAEPGDYHIWTGKPDQHNVSLLEEMKFDRAAYLYMNEAGFDVLKGLDGIRQAYESHSWVASPEYFSLTNAFAAKTWKFNFKTKDGKTGALTLPMPLQMVQFRADIHDGKTSGGGGPLLYKEWRFKGAVQTGNGFFQAGIVKPTSYFLVLQGRGNACDNSGDFTNWRLEIDGKKARYAFFGKLSSANSESTETAETEQP
ncbi:MAG TPA: hypothetical protein VK400_11465 [Pyrinomonadaceae bacterium]|nr:hypothetical protein [Pyrinomonadaceae bacterium]